MVALLELLTGRVLSEKQLDEISKVVDWALRKGVESAGSYPLQAGGEDRYKIESFLEWITILSWYWRRCWTGSLWPKSQSKVEIMNFLRNSYSQISPEKEELDALVVMVLNLQRCSILALSTRFCNSLSISWTRMNSSVFLWEWSCLSFLPGWELDTPLDCSKGVGRGVKHLEGGWIGVSANLRN